MNTIAEDLMRAVLDRLQGPTPIVTDDNRVRRSHRTVVARDKAPAVHLIDGAEVPDQDSKCATSRKLEFTVRLIVRDDDGFTAADPLKIAVMARLDPESEAYAVYPHGARIVPGRITPEAEIADGDSLSVEMDFTFKFETTGWSLSA